MKIGRQPNSAHARRVRAIHTEDQLFQPHYPSTRLSGAFSGIPELQMFSFDCSSHSTGFLWKEGQQ